MTTIHHTLTNTVISMDDAALAADIAFMLDIKYLAQQPHAVALVEEAGASLGYASDDVALASALVRDAQAILAAHAARALDGADDHTAAHDHV